MDSQCFSYLLDALEGVAEPTGVLGPERLALVRLFFYVPGIMTLPPTVVIECEAIRRAERRDVHASWRNIHFDAPSVGDPARVGDREAELMRRHNRRADCRILAEAEDFGLMTLLTHDRDLLARLTDAGSPVRLQRPSEYWTHLDIPRGASPDKVPHESNPLAAQSWWRW